MSKKLSGRKSAYETLIVDLYRLKWDEPDITFNEILRRMYVDNKMSMHKMAKEFNVAPGTIHNWLKEAGITSRKMTWM